MRKRNFKSEEEQKAYQKKRREEKRKYYARTSGIYPRHFWTEEEELMVMEHSIPDSALSDKLGRSMKSIQEKRRKLRRLAEKAQEEQAENEKIGEN